MSVLKNGFIPVYETVSGHESEIVYYRRNTVKRPYWQGEEVLEPENEQISYYLAVSHYGQLSAGFAYRMATQIIEWANTVLPAEFETIPNVGQWRAAGAGAFTAHAPGGSVLVLDTGLGAVRCALTLDSVTAAELYRAVSWLSGFLRAGNGVSAHE